MTLQKTHSTNVVIILDGNDLSEYLEDSTWDDTNEKQMVTTYGNRRNVYDYGLGDGKLTISGVYDVTENGPKAVIEEIKDDKRMVTLVRRPEGTGSGKPQESVSVLIEKYTETAPVAGYVKFACDVQPSGDITRTTQ